MDVPFCPITSAVSRIASHAVLSNALQRALKTRGGIEEFKDTLHAASGLLRCFRASKRSVLAAILFVLFVPAGFSQYTASTFAVSGYTASGVFLADMNNDGLTDVVVRFTQASTGNAYIGIWLQTSAHTFNSSPTSLMSTGSPCSGCSMTVGDFNHDGNVDVAFASGGEDATLEIYAGNGNGTVSSTVTPSAEVYAGGYLTTADVNGDGIPDVLFAFYGTTPGPQIQVAFGPFTNGRPASVIVQGFGGLTPYNASLLPKFNANGAALGLQNIYLGVDAQYVATSYGSAIPNNSALNDIWNVSGAVALPVTNTGLCIPVDVNQDGAPDCIFSVINSANFKIVLSPFSTSSAISNLTVSAGSISGSIAESQPLTYSNESYPQDAVFLSTSQSSPTSSFTSAVTALTNNGNNAFTARQLYSSTDALGIGTPVLGGDFQRSFIPIIDESNATAIVLTGGQYTIPTTTSIASSANPSAYTGNVTFTCQVSFGGGTPTGNVVFSLDGTSVSTQALNSGSASYATSSLSAGSHTIACAYQGGGPYGTSASSLSQTVNIATPSISLAAVSSTVTYGDFPSFTLQVGCNSACGQVQWALDGVPWGTNSLGSSGQGGAGALSVWPAGSHTVTATYLGDSDYNSVSASVGVTVDKATPTVTFNTLPNPVPAGQSFTTSVQVSCNASCGQVDYRFNGSEWGTVSLSSTGYYTATHSPAVAGTYPVQVNYLGNANYNAVTTTPETLTVARDHTITQLSSNNNPSNYGSSTTFTALVNTGRTTPTGSISFTSGGTSIGTEAITDVSTTNLIPYSQQIGNSPWNGWCGPTNTTLNTNTVTAPDGTNTATQVVIPSYSGTYTCGAGYGFGFFGSIAGGLKNKTTYTASIWLRGAVGGETVTFGLDDGYATVVTLTKNWQRYSFTATYTNDGEQSRGFEVLDDQQPGVTYYAWGAQVEAANAIGPYVETQATSQIGSGGVASVSTSALAIGSHAIVATYAGDANTLASSSSSLTQVISPPTPVIASITPTSAVAGSIVTLSGANFGEVQGASTITFNGITATPISWSATSIAVPVPAGATTGNVVVTVNGVKSVGTAFAVSPTPTPAITGIAPSSGAVGTQIVLTGTNLGSQDVGTVTIGGVAATVNSWASTQITVTVPVSLSVGPASVVVTENGVSSSSSSFTVLPSITGLSLSQGPVQMGFVITGTNFGATQGKSTVTLNGLALTVLSWSSGSIVVQVPAGASTGNVVITNSGYATNGVSFTVVPPFGCS